ncbi:MAG: ABC transporter ATP-binding protein [Curvibacter sp.]
MSAQAIALQARGLRVRLDEAEVLHGINLQLRAARWTSIVGPNGAGQSTLLKSLAQLLAHEGTVHLLGEDLAYMDRRARARRLAWVGQGELPGDDLNVYDVVLLGRLPHRAWLAPPSAADLAAVEQALRASQAWDWRERSLSQLSGGERQRVLLARALAVQAEVLLMDEPLANLDPPHQADWLQLVRDLVARGRTVVTVLHELTFALQADELVVMAAGSVRHQGACADTATHRALENVFEQRIAIHTLNGCHVALPRT